MEQKDVSLRDYIDLRIKNVEQMLIAQKEFQSQHFQLNELAIKKAEDTMNARLEGMNEWREQSKEREVKYVTREMMDLVVENRNSLLGVVDKRITILERASSFSAGKMWMVMAIFAAIPTVMAIIALFRG